MSSKARDTTSYIIGGRRYTPEKSVVMCRVSDLTGTATLYRTQKGAFFKVQESDGEETAVGVVDKDEALIFLDAHPASINQEAYAVAFGEPQEG